MCGSQDTNHLLFILVKKEILFNMAPLVKVVNKSWSKKTFTWP